MVSLSSYPQGRGSPHMKVTFTGTLRGKKIYAVVDGSDRMFSGTLEEVKRYLLVRNHKIRERENALAAHLQQVRTES